MGKGAGSKAGGGGGGGGKGKGAGGGGSASRAPVSNAVTKELANGGVLQSRKDLRDFKEFGVEKEWSGFSVDRRDPRINNINRDLRKEKVKVKVWDSPGPNRVRVLDARDNTYFVEFV